MIDADQPTAASPAPAPASDRPTARARLARLPFRNELLALAVLLLVTRLLPKPAPLGIYGLGVVNGSTIALQAIALVLIYRSNRIINFAQASFGAAAGVLFSTMVEYKPLLRLIDPLCPDGCVQDPVAANVNYVLSLALAVGVAMLFGWLSYVVVIKRFANAPRLLLTVATIFIGAVVASIVSTGVTMLVPGDLRDAGGPPPGTVPAPLPFDLVLRFGGVRFHAVHLLTIAAAVVAAVGLFLYLRRSASGNAIRAAAENPDRAETLGINVSAMTGRVWLIAAGLAGVAGVLGMMTEGGVTGGAGTAEIYILAVAVIARLHSLPMAAAGAVVLGVVEQAVQWSFGTTVSLQGSLFILIGALLLLQSGKMSRAEHALTGEWRAAEEVRPIPSQLRDHPTVRAWARFGIAVGLVVALGFPWAMPPSTTSLAVAIIAYAIVGLSLLVLTGWAGQISLGQVAFAAIGAYVAAIARLPFPLALVAGAVAGALAATLVGIPALRLRGFHLAVMTLAFHEAVVAIGLNPRYLGAALPSSMGGTTLLGLDLRDQRVYYYAALLVAVAVTLAVLGMRRSRTARALLATRDNEQAAQAFGIALTRARIGAFAASGAIAAIGGVVLAFQLGRVQAAAFGVPLSRTVFLHTVIGGLGTVAGPIIGMLYYALPQLLTLPQIVGLLLSGPGGLALLLMTRGGLGELVFAARDAWLRRIARRNRIVVPSLLADVAADRAEERAPLEPKTRAGGAVVFVPSRYELPAQWAVAPERPAKETPRA